MGIDVGQCFNRARQRQTSKYDVGRLVRSSYSEGKFRIPIRRPHEHV